MKTDFTTTGFVSFYLLFFSLLLRGTDWVLRVVSCCDWIVRENVTGCMMKSFMNESTAWANCHTARRHIYLPPPPAILPATQLPQAQQGRLRLTRRPSPASNKLPSLAPACCYRPLGSQTLAIDFLSSWTLPSSARHASYVPASTHINGSCPGTHSGEGVNKWARYQLFIARWWRN